MDFNEIVYLLDNNVTFDSHKGLLTVLEVWRLPLESSNNATVSLDSVSKLVLSEISKNEETSLIVKANKLKEVLDVKLKLLKYLVDRRQKRAAELDEKHKRQSEIEDIKFLIESKRLENLKNLSIEELEKRLVLLKS